MNPNIVVPWTPADLPALPANAKPYDIVPQALQLHERDQKALLLAFDTGAYAMAATFVWSRAMAALKKQLAVLGMEFLGEMLGRTDLDESSNAMTDIREDEAIMLAEQLGTISTPEAIHLRNGQTLVNHFLSPDISRHEQMVPEEALSIVRSCVVNFLGDSNGRWQQPLLHWKAKLESETFQEASPEAQTLARFPYFFVHTTLAVLLTQLKTATREKLECAAGNIQSLLPVMWPRLRDKDRWQTGETYSIVQAWDRLVAAKGLLSVLMRVKGFDYVPDSMRSGTFRSAARAVLSAHFSSDSFSSEPGPMEALAQRGAAVPGPALADCFSATLCVHLGNPYGHSCAAQPAVERLLKLFRTAHWETYLNRMLPGDANILEKLAFADAPLHRWQELISQLDLESLTLDRRVAKLVASDLTKRGQIKQAAKVLRERMMQET